MSSSFVHLHLHTQFSLLDGANQIEPLVQQIKSFGQPAVAMTDHGNMFGAIEFYRKAKDAGIKTMAVGLIIHADHADAGAHHHLRRRQLVDLRQRIRDVRQGPDELLYVLTDEEDGAVLRIEPR